MSDMPNEQQARRIAEEVLGETPQSCVRFTTGLRHWVYDVAFESGRQVVIRLGHPDNAAELAGGVFWCEHLQKVDVPVAAVLAHNVLAHNVLAHNVLAHDVNVRQPFMVLERLAGTDLGNCFDDLTDAQLQRICATVVDMQHCTSRLPRASGFGYALSYRALLMPTWFAVLEASIERSTRWITEVGSVDPQWGRRVRNRLNRSTAMFDAIEPIAFLHDATTKNVIVSNGVVSGLVDVDEMAFGDPLWATGLTKVSLLSAHRSTTYADEQAALLSSTDSKVRDRLEIYTAIHCLGFLAEFGRQFNQEKPTPIDMNQQQHLEEILEGLL